MTVTSETAGSAGFLPGQRDRWIIYVFILSVDLLHHHALSHALAEGEEREEEEKEGEGDKEGGRGGQGGGSKRRGQGGGDRRGQGGGEGEREVGKEEEKEGTRKGNWGEIGIGIGSR